ncbi:hypothetical protein EXZ60_01860 [Vibrio sp. 1151_11]|uniref:hypothetical protein n=1 Tax=Vibrio sp. 1151_11 TaxID=2527670 RepID=UPI002405FC8B|nr:hypothetical protein [Vibrio sp. 1151_11]MDF9387610.1 hypothetical protein [Vibrio sp. 1151_11]
MNKLRTKTMLTKPKFHSDLSQREPLAESTTKKASFQPQPNLLRHQIFRAELQQVNQSKKYFNLSDLKLTKLNTNQIQNLIEVTQEP